MATESVIIEPRHSPLLFPNKVEADEYELSPAHKQLFLVLLILLFSQFFIRKGIEEYQEELYVYLWKSTGR